MNKPYLLIAGHNYYPSAGTGDWIGRFETKDQITNSLEELYYDDLFKQGPRKGQLKEKRKNGYIIFGIGYDWYEIVDLRDWTE